MSTLDIVAGTIIIFAIGVGFGYYVAKLVFGV